MCKVKEAVTGISGTISSLQALTTSCSANVLLVATAVKVPTARAALQMSSDGGCKEADVWKGGSELGAVLADGLEEGRL